MSTRQTSNTSEQQNTERKLTDLEIAQQAELLPIAEIAAKLGLQEDEWEGYGRYKAKVDLSVLERTAERPEGKLILVTAMNPTVAGEGKTTVSVGLAQAMNRLNHRTVLALREPSMGPVFGMKGGATGGGYSQVVPMEEINLHFTGDMHAITAANNLLAALIDNHIQHGNELGLDPRRIVWKRALDMNDRALRQVIIGLGGKQNGTPREDGFDITVASEIMAILCLAQDLHDLKEMIGNILIGYTYSNDPVYVRQLKVQGAIAALLKDALKPNLVQTLEHTPVLIHGGPFANIAHGCNSILATKMAMRLGEYAVTEAGFGADLGAEKFFHIKCRKGKLVPSAVVLAATIRALKLHGGMSPGELHTVNPEAVKRGFANVEHHVEMLRKFEVPIVIALNHFYQDDEEEIAVFESLCQSLGIEYSIAKVWEHGGEGGLELAAKVIAAAQDSPARLPMLYDTEQDLRTKIEAIAREIYGASSVVFSDQAERQLKQIARMGWDRLPVCMAKTQYSLSDNPALIGRPQDFAIHVRELQPKLGAGFIVALTGKMLTMPGLPRMPMAIGIDLDDQGRITGLS